MIKKNPIWWKEHLVNIGPRYVFFNTLALETLPIYNYYYTYGKGLVKNASSMLTGNDDKQSQDAMRIQKYVEMIGQAAENARTIELKFFSTIKSMIKDNNELQNKINTFLIDYEKTSTFNYLEFMKLLQEIMIENNKLNQELHDRYLQNMREYNKIYEAAGEQMQEILKESYQNFTKKEGKIIYSNYLNEQLRNFDKTNETKSIITQGATIFSNTINKAINFLLKNQLLQEQLGASFQEQGIQEDKISDYILTAITQEIFSKDSLEYISTLTGEQIIDNILQTINQKKINLLQPYTEQVVNSFQKKIKRYRSIEDLVLTNKGRGVGKVYASLDEESKKELIDFYGIDEEVLNKVFPTNRGQMAHYSKIISDAVRATYKDSGIEEKMQEALKQKNLSDKRKKIKNIRENIKSATSQQHITNKLEENLSVKMTVSSVSELLLSANEKIFTKLFNDKNHVQRFKIGEINLKTDNIIGILSDNVIPEITGPLRLELFDILSQTSINFLERYHKEGNGEINIEAAEKAFRQEQDVMKTNIENFLKRTGMEKQKINKSILTLSNFINQSISVKDYQIYLNSEGFHAQSLGANSEKTIDNIIKMYEFGGISDIDKDLLLFAVNNCSEDTIGSTLKNDLATFLLGGAALITFDQGFTLLQHYINNFKKEYDTTQMLLYHLQGKFIPASYVLTSVYNNLQKVYFNIENELYNVSKKQNQVHITNNLNYNDVPDFEIVPMAQDRWDIVKEKAEKTIQIKMSFMAGLLDIYENIKLAFQY